MDWGSKSYAELVQELNGSTAYKFEVVDGRVALKVDGLMGSLKRASGRQIAQTNPKTAAKPVALAAQAAKPKAIKARKSGKKT